MTRDTDGAREERRRSLRNELRRLERRYGSGTARGGSPYEYLDARCAIIRNELKSLKAKP